MTFKKTSLAICFAIICQYSYAHKFDSNINKFINIFNQFCIDSSNFSDQAVNLEKNNFIILPTKYQQKFPLIHKDQGLVYAEKYDENYYIVGIDPKNTCEVLSNNENLQNIENNIVQNYKAILLKKIYQNGFVSRFYTAKNKEDKPLMLQIRYIPHQTQNNLMLRVKRISFTQKDSKLVSSIKQHMTKSQIKYIKDSKPNVTLHGEKFVSNNGAYQFLINPNWKKINPVDPTTSFSLACVGTDCATNKIGRRTIINMAFKYLPTVAKMSMSALVSHLGKENLENKMITGIIHQPSVTNFKRYTGEIIKIGNYYYFSLKTSYKFKGVNAELTHYILISFNKNYFTQIAINCSPNNCKKDYPLALNVIKTLKYL